MGWMRLVATANVAVRLARMDGLLPSAPAGSGTAAALLAGTGLLLTWIARAPEDWITSQILVNARRSLIASAVLAAIVTVFLSVPVWEPARSITWWVLLALAFVNLVIAARQRRLLSVPEATVAAHRGGSDDDEK